MANLKWLAGVFAVLAGCGLTTPNASFTPNSHDPKLVQPVRGKFVAIDGSQIDLSPSNSNSSSQIIMFISETCSICRRETKNLVLDRANRGVPKNVVFYSIVVGSLLDDAKDWRAGLNVDWQVGVDPGDELFRQYCTEGQTPCMFLTNPSSNLAVKLIGEHSLAEWEKITGSWIFQGELFK